MEDFESNRNENGDAVNASESVRQDNDEGYVDSPATADNTNEQTSESGYAYHPDETYRYPGAAEERRTDEQSAYPYRNNGYQPQSPQYTGQYDAKRAGGAPQDGAYPGGAAPQNGPYGTGGAYPYQNPDPYPYQSRPRGYAYQENNGGVQKKSNGGKIFGIITGTLCLVLVAALVTVIAFGSKNKASVSANQPDASESEDVTRKENADELVTQESPEAVGRSGSKGELTPKEIYKKVLASSVGILVYNKSDSLASEGTGVLFQEDNDGDYTYIVTCAHVISGNNGTVMVQLHNEEQYKAEIVGFDNRTDIGVLKIKESGLTLAEIGDSSKLSVGDDVYAIGNPGGVEFANSFTGGMISALDRPVNSSSSGYTMECIQHTAAINPGNSGGALVNAFGQVIGINSMKIVDDEYEGMGFSVPSSVFVDIVNNLIANGYVANRPKLGITYVAAQNYNSYGMFVAIKELPKGSIVIYSISADSSLADTEAQQGDMIIAVNGKDLDDSSYLPELIEKSNVGDEITLTLIRINRDYSFEEFDVTATLVEDRGDTTIEQEPTTEQPGDDGDYFRDYFDDYFRDYFGDFFR